VDHLEDFFLREPFLLYVVLIHNRIERQNQTDPAHAISERLQVLLSTVVVCTLNLRDERITRLLVTYLAQAGRSLARNLRILVFEQFDEGVCPAWFRVA